MKVPISSSAGIGREQRIIHLKSVQYLLLMALTSVFLSACNIANNKTRSGLEPVIVALELYRNDRGIYPYELDGLVPKYLPELPQTPKKYTYSTNCREFYLIFNHHWIRQGFGWVDGYCSKTNKWYVSEDTEPPEICVDYHHCEKVCTQTCEDWDENDICCRY